MLFKKLVGFDPISISTDKKITLILLTILFR